MAAANQPDLSAVTDPIAADVSASEQLGSSAGIRNKILLVGRTTRNLLHVLEGVFEIAGAKAALPSVPPESEHEPLVVPWTIDTKYYTARVDFWLDVCPTGTPEDGVLTAYDKIGEAFDAFIFVLDKATPESLEDLKHWLPFVDLHQPSITLCVGSTFGRTPASDVELEADHFRMEMWCLDKGFEYVDLEEKPVDDDANAERVGPHRLIEALETHMWEGLKRKQGTETAVNELDEGGEVDEEFINELLNMKVKDLPDPGDISDVGSANLENSADEHDLDFESFEKTHNQIFGSFDSEDGFEHAVDSIRSLRDHCKTLPDADRKKLAAEVALSFANQFAAE